MAAPSGTTWGSTVGSKGRIGLYTSLSSTNTQTTLTVQIWFWSKYSVSDSNNTLYYNNLAKSGSATTSKGSVTVKTTVATGSGWSKDNQKKLKTYTVTYDRKTSAQTRYLYAKLKGIDVVGSGAAMSVSKTVSIPALPSYTVSYNANGGSGAPANQTKWYGTNLTLSITKPTRTGYTFVGWGSSSTSTSAVNQPGGTYSGNAAYTYYAIWRINTWTVSYNANGGSGAPGSQTKTYGQTLTLSTTKPTRTGYDFLGWSTSSSATSAAYSAGSSYTSNSAATLYAVWRLKTYTITYNANGGTGGPTTQTKTHGTALSITASTPTKPEYNFLGWATSATSTTVSYKADSSYTSEAAITLYAVWELAYKKPRITNVSVKRCFVEDEVVTLTEEGTYAYVKFDYEADFEVTSIGFMWKLSTDTKYTHGTYYIPGYDAITGPLTFGTSGTIDDTTGFGEIDPYLSYDFKIEVSDGVETTSVVTPLSAITYTIDMLGGGKGVAFGKIAEHENLADFAFQANFGGGVKNQLIEDGYDLDALMIPNVYYGNTGSGYLNCPITNSNTFTLEVMSGGSNGQLMQRIITCDKTNPRVWIRHYYTSAWGNWVPIIYDTSWCFAYNYYCQYRAKNGWCTVKGISWGDYVLPKGEYRAISTIPEGYRPSDPQYFSVGSIGANKDIFGYIGTDGILYLFSNEEYGYWSYSVTYPVG